MINLVSIAREVLEAIDFPFESLPPAWAARTPIVVLALGGLSPGSSLGDLGAWGDGRTRIVGSRQLICRLNDDWGERISSGSYDEVRRRCVQFLVAAQVACKDPDNPSRSPNSPATGYSLSPQFVRLMTSHGSKSWRRELSSFLATEGSLRAKLRAERAMHMVPLSLPSGEILRLSPGDHNKLQAAVIKEFLPRFAPGCELVYVADALDRQSYLDEALIAETGLFTLKSQRLPDIVVLDRPRGWLIIIEAVASSGHISPLRKLELGQLLANCRYPPVYVSAFPDYATFGRYAGDIAWESEAWIAEHPTHMIHFNGERYLGPYAE